MKVNCIDVQVIKLLIDEKPLWSMKTKKWSYNYVYGFCGDHEGHAREEDLDLGPGVRSFVTPSSYK